MTTATANTIRLQDAARVEWHGHWASPWCGMCLDYAAEKGVHLDMERRDRGEIAALTGQPRMPAVILTLEGGDRVCLSESTRIIELLDRSYPPPQYASGWSDDPGLRAQQELMEHAIGAIHLQLLDVATQELGPQGSMPALLENILAEQGRIFGAINQLAEGASPFFFGALPSVLDYQIFHAEPFNRCIVAAMRLGKRSPESFPPWVPKMPILALLGDPDFTKMPDVDQPPQGDAYLQWRNAVDDRREAHGLRRGTFWQKQLPNLEAT